MHLNIKITAVIVSAFLAASCSTVRSGLMDNSQPLRTNVVFTKSFFLLPTECMAETIDSYQNIQVKFLGKEFVFPVLMQADKEKIYVALLNTPAGTDQKIEYKNDTITTNIDFPKKISPEDLTAYFQWCFYDMGSVAHILEKNNLHFTVEKKENKQTEIRRIYNEKKCIVEITKSPEEIRFVHYGKNYSCIIKPAE